jgi:cation:H+ antiporter
MCGVGILMLGAGATWLVDGASRLALRLGVSPMVVGLTVVGFGTSMPEFSVSVLAAARGSGGLSLGNAVGSNIMNLVLVLGLSALVFPIHVIGSRRVMLRDMSFGLLPAILILVVAWDGSLGRGLGLLLVAVFFVFMVTCVRGSRNSKGKPPEVAGSPVAHIALTVFGIVVLVAGAELMVRGGVQLARDFGISEAVIGLTLVAFGTSLPELATSVAAAVKRQAELSVGNVLGSNIFNLGLIVGTAFAIRPGQVPIFVVQQDIPALIAATVLVGMTILRNGRISRGEGALFLTVFAAYFVFVALRGG